MLKGPLWKAPPFDSQRRLCVTHGTQARSSQQAASSRGICFDFAKGRCTRGAACRFSHDLSAEQPGMPAACLPCAPGGAPLALPTRPVAVPVMTGRGGSGGGGGGGMAPPLQLAGSPPDGSLGPGSPGGSSYAAAAAVAARGEAGASGGTSYANVAGLQQENSLPGAGGYDSAFPLPPSSGVAQQAPRGGAGGSGYAVAAGMAGQQPTAQRGVGGGMYAQSGYRGAPGQAPPQQQQGGYMQGGHMGLVNGMAGMALDRNGAPYGYANEAVVGMGGGMEGWGMEQARQAQQQATYAEGMQPEGAAMDPGLVSELMKMAPWLMPDGSGGGGPGGGGGGAAAAVGMAQQQQRYNAQAQYAAQYAGQGGQPAAMGALGGGMDGYMSQAAAMQQQ